MFCWILRAGEGSYDLLAVDSNWSAEIFSGGFLQPIDAIDPTFRLDPAVSQFDETIFWNPAEHSFDAKGGHLMGVPINGNVDALFYRMDLYETHKLQVPETWDDLLANAEALNDPPRRYGMVHWDDRTFVTADFSNYMFSYGGGVFANPQGGNYSVVFNSPSNLRALEFYIALGRKGGYPTPGSLSQAAEIQLLLTGRAAHAVSVIGAWGQMDDPNLSAVVGKMNAALMPRAAQGVQHACRAGHWVGAIARNVPAERQKAALAFLSWFSAYPQQVVYTEAGAVPVRTDVIQSDLSKQPRFRFLQAQVANSKVARIVFPVPQGAQIFAMTDLQLNQAVIGQQSPARALNTCAEQIYSVMQGAGYRTGKLPDLPD
jgi:multiple sugar transport system substrate-binding protein